MAERRPGATHPRFSGDGTSGWIWTNHDPDVTPSEAGKYGRISDPNQRHNRDLYGFPVEMDPGQDSGLYYRSAAVLGVPPSWRQITAGKMPALRWSVPNNQSCRSG